MGGELIERDTSGVRNGTDTVDYSVNSRNPTEKPNENDSKVEVEYTGGRRGNQASRETSEGGCSSGRSRASNADERMRSLPKGKL